MKLCFGSVALLAGRTARRVDHRMKCASFSIWWSGVFLVPFLAPGPPASP
ncbi:MAG TPA: hypothetical protein VL242_06375 [Sorangium sp.]|nr:hypothetical protein [Sorangium sp.]